MTVSIVLFTADLRVHDHPPLRAALDSSDAIVPLFVVDDAIAAGGFATPNRRAFLADCLADLDEGLRQRGGRLVVRSGELAAEVCRVAAEADAEAVHMAAGVSAYAHAREERLRRALAGDGRELHVHDAVITAIAPGALTPSTSGSDHFAVFTPYFRRWSAQPLRGALPAPRRIEVPEAIGSEPLPRRADAGAVSPGLARGGETRARAALATWLRQGITTYEDLHDDMAGDATSRLSPHLHFGTLSAVEAIHRSRGGTGGGSGTGPDAFVRQLCWRDFHHQVLAARPDASVRDYRTRNDRWRGEEEAADEIAAWKEGRTGYPVVDAAMRQLAHEGWMHNRGRLLTSSFLAKTLYVDWRVGARHFLELLVDGDVANNQLNWQWTAGTGTDSRPNRILNPVTQGKRYDPDGSYVHRWVPELKGLDGPHVHAPWNLEGLDRAQFDYPDPIVDLSESRARFLEARGKE
ncbi:cryptochrome/photolyase family protein [Actinomycetota bacterium Odt1-20B]